MGNKEGTWLGWVTEEYRWEWGGVLWGLVGDEDKLEIGVLWGGGGKVGWVMGNNDEMGWRKRQWRKSGNRVWAIERTDGTKTEKGRWEDLKMRCGLGW